MSQGSADIPLPERLAQLELLERAAAASNEQPTLAAAAQVVVAEVCAFTGWPSGQLTLVGGREPPPPPGSLVARVVATGRPAWADGPPATDHGAWSSLAFPVRVGPDVVAVLQFRVPEPEGPRQGLLDVLGAVAGQLARVAERDRAGAVLRQSEERFRALAQSANDAIVTADESGLIASWNGGADRMFGWSEHEVVGQPLTVLMPTRLADAHRKGFRRHLTTGEARAMGRTLELVGLRRDGSEFPLELSLSGWSTPEGRFFSGILRDITDRRQAEDERRRFEQEMAERALRDQLTGLPNRALFLDRLDHALARARRVGRVAAVICCDIDRFRAVNHHFGSSVGDQVVAAVGRRLDDRLRPGDTVARMGGDEFAVLCEDVDGADGAVALAHELQEVFTSPFSSAAGDVWVTASMGVAVAAAGAGAEVLLREAATAMDGAKQRGRGRFEVFDEAMRAGASWRHATEHELRDAIAGGQLRLVYQPVVHLATGEMAGVEALVRWRHPSRGMLRPVDFIPLAEESGLVVPLGSWVLGEACRQGAAWQSLGSHGQPLSVGVNVSAHQLQRADWPAEVASTLEGAGLSGENLVLELTESTIMEDSDLSIRRLGELRGMGVRLAIDDFGTGYSSLAYLKRMPVDFLKIDKGFVDGVTGGPHESALARAVVKLAATMSLAAVAEGIERREQAEVLRSLGCSFGQGLWLGSPDPPDAITARLRSS